VQMCFSKICVSRNKPTDAFNGLADLRLDVNDSKQRA
jgi:hypothetical protein